MVSKHTKNRITKSILVRLPAGEPEATNTLYRIFCRHLGQHSRTAVVIEGPADVTISFELDESLSERASAFLKEMERSASPERTPWACSTARASSCAHPAIQEAG